MERIDTQNGLFAAGNPQTGIPGTIVTAKWLNAIQEELANVVEEAGLDLDGASQTQLYEAIVAIIAAQVNAPLVAATTPTADVGPLIFILDRWQWAVRVATAFYTGYRSLQCGDWYIGSMSQNHRPQEIDGIGGIFDIAAYPSLWGWAQENNHVVDAADWEPKWTHYALIGTTQFRVPDYRNVFPRAAGTDADTANPRLVGTYQADALQNITGEFGITALASGYFGIGAMGPKDITNQVWNGGSSGFAGKVDFDAGRVARTSTETRGASAAVAPMILI